MEIAEVRHYASILCTSNNKQIYKIKTPFTQKLIVNCFGANFHTILSSALDEDEYKIRVTGICGGQSSIETGFSPSTSTFPCKYHSSSAPDSFGYLSSTLFNLRSWQHRQI